MTTPTKNTKKTTISPKKSAKIENPTKTTKVENLTKTQTKLMENPTNPTKVENTPAVLPQNPIKSETTDAIITKTIENSTITTEIAENQKEAYSPEHLRKRILIVLKNVERFPEYNSNLIMEKLKLTFQCQSIVLAVENTNNTINYHIGVQNNDASRYTAKKLIEKAFPEFTENSLSINFPKSFSTQSLK